MSTHYQPGSRVSEYVLEECVGAGTFGEVWRARHHVWKTEQVAVKLPTEPEYVRFLQREGVVVHGIRHPNVIRVIGLDPYGETPYLVMELVRGPSLRDMLDKHPKGLDIPVALAILRGLLQGLSAAHGANVVHRDLKPGNVLLNLDERTLDEISPDDVKIGDFGLGVDNANTLRSMVMQSASIEQDAQGSAIAGTLAYMAPELRDGHHEPTSGSDLYSVGVILYEMLTGERPAGAEMPSTLRAEVPTVLDNVVRKLYTRYDRRYESADEILADLDAALAPPPPVPHPVAPGRGVPDPLQSKPETAPPRTSRRTHSYAQCPECRRPTEPEDQYCTHCGRQLVEEVLRCSSCGGYPGPNDRFCIFCGKSVDASED